MPHSIEPNCEVERDTVAAFRAGALAGGYSQIAVKSGNKIPSGSGWQNGHEQGRLLPPRNGELNTGILAAGLICVDVDIDDLRLARTARHIAERVFGQSIVRIREGSARMLMVYRAADGQPGKRVRAGEAGKVELLGKGQQAVAHGIHPDGTAYEWEGDKGPHNVALIDVPAVTEEQVTAFLSAVEHLIGSGGTPTRQATGNVVPLMAGSKPAIFAGRADLPDMNAAAGAGLENDWFTQLDIDQKNDFIRQVFACPSVAAIAHGSRSEWLPILFGAAHAERLGATAAREAALAWSMTGASFNARDFDRSWASFRDGRAGVGTLIHLAKQGGLNLTRWAVPTLVRSPSPFGTGPASFFTRAQTHAAALDRPPWLAPGLLMRGDTTIIAGQGGSAKTACAVHIAVAISAGRPGSGQFIFNPRPDGQELRVAYISAEEGENSLNLLTTAASSTLCLDAAERAKIDRNLILHDARASGWRAGEAAAMATLSQALSCDRVDLLILDTAASVFALDNENDNGAVTRILTAIGQMAVTNDIAVLVLHHTPKMTRENAAAQRGEVTAVRGGGAYVNASRVVLSITPIPAAEAGAVIMAGHHPDRVRRLEHVKINDQRPMDPAHFEITEAQVQIRDGSMQAVRAIRFIGTPSSANVGGASTAIRNIVMHAIDAGARDPQGAKVPLSPPGAGGKTNGRDAIGYVSRALVHADPSITKPHAEALARETMADLMDRVGCAVTKSVLIPKYKANGTRNGSREAVGLIADWSLAPWAAASTPNAALNSGGATAQPADAPTIVVPEGDASADALAVSKAEPTDEDHGLSSAAV